MFLRQTHSTLFLFFLITANCGSSITAPQTPTYRPNYTIGGNISGLTGTVILENNGDNGLALSQDGAFEFGDTVDSGDSYEVTVATQPTRQTCTITHGSGTATANVTDVDVTCITDFNVLFTSTRAIDGSDAAHTNNTANIWTVNLDGTGLTALTETTADFSDNSAPQWSPDGSKIVFESTRAIDGSDAANTNNTSNIWVMDADGTDLTALTATTADAADNTAPQWSPDGSKIVFESTRAVDGSDAANTNSTSNIWVMDVDGTDLTALTTTTNAQAGAFEPQWSPDGSQIVFDSARALNGSDAVNTNNTVNVWSVDVDGTNLTALTELTALNATNDQPQWSPDGTQILFHSARHPNGTDTANTNDVANLWVMDADGSNPVALTNTTAIFTDTFNPQWSPDGSQIVFYSRRHLDESDALNTNSTANIWLIDADGSNLTALTTAEASDAESYTPQWSQDGETIVFHSIRAVDGSDAANTNNTANIWTVGVDGTQLTALTEATADAADSSEAQLGP